MELNESVDGPQQLQESCSLSSLIVELPKALRITTPSLKDADHSFYHPSLVSLCSFAYRI
jgi:hypothetical protein